MVDFYYDEQLRRYLLQFLRIFSGFRIQLAPDENGVQAEKVIPIVYGDMSRQIGHILRDNSQNTTLQAPAMSGYVVSLEMDPSRRYDPTNVNPVRAIEREYDGEAEQYSSEAGNRYMVERYMPVPYVLTMNLDIWTTNTTDKLQILEQILAIFNPTIQIQTHNNPLDWTTITEVELVAPTWSTKGVPTGPDDPNDVATLTFRVPIWISSPAKVTRQRIVEQIVANVYDVDISNVDQDAYDPLHSAFTPLDQYVISPGNYKLEVTPVSSTVSTVRLLNEYGQTDPSITWKSLTAAYGKIDPDTTILRLKTMDDIENTSGDVLGSLEVTDDTTAIGTFTVDADTLPETIDGGAVDAIIDPRQVYPGDGLPVAAVGQRYLLISDDDTIGGERIIAHDDGNNPWGTVSTFEHDIIEYNGTNWFVSFDSGDVTPPLYVVNLDDEQHYKFDGNDWVYTYIGTFSGGYWRVEL